ncbi:MAG: formyltransferase family protein [Polyangiaceae bacterium]
MRIGFFGLPLAALCLLADGHDLQWGVLSPISAPGLRRLRIALGARPLLLAAERSESALVADIDALVRSHPPDLIVSWYWTRRIQTEWLDSTRLGGVGVHPSLLPRHRGPNPFFWTIDRGDELAGASVHWLDANYDTGRVIAQRSLPVGHMNSWQLARALDRVSLAALRDAVGALSRGEALDGVAQDEAKATWAPEPADDALILHPSWDVERAARRIRALSPVPGLSLCVRGLDLFVTAVVTAPGPEPLAPGEAAVWPGTERVALAVQDGVLLIERAVDAETGLEFDGAALAAEVARRAPDAD